MAGAAIIALGVWNIHTAEQRGAFEQRQAARHEAPVGRLVRAHTERNSVVLAFERSGSLRYYAGRMTLRYDVLEPDWLDRAVTTGFPSYPWYVSDPLLEPVRRDSSGRAFLERLRAQWTAAKTRYD